MTEILSSIRSVSEEIRIRLLLLLTDREACVCELMAVFDMAQSKLSHHLITLRDAGFLQDEKRGKWNYYIVNTKALNPVNRDILASLTRWHNGEKTIEDDKSTLEKVQRRMQICC